MEKLANSVHSFFVSVCAVDLYNSEHPLILCTDDSGVFSTSVSGEYILASTKFGTSIFYIKIDSFSINILVTIFPTISKIWDRKKCSNLQAGQLTSFLLTKELKRNWRRYLYQLLKSWTYNYNCFQFQIAFTGCYITLYIYIIYHFSSSDYLEDGKKYHCRIWILSI